MFKEAHAVARKPSAIHPEKGAGYNRGAAEAEEREIIAEEGDEEARISRIKDVFTEMKRFFGKDLPLVLVERNYRELVGKARQFLLEYNTADDTNAVRLQIARWMADLSK